jgi:hypothetical protein
VACSFLHSHHSAPRHVYRYIPRRSATGGSATDGPKYSKPAASPPPTQWYHPPPPSMVTFFEPIVLQLKARRASPSDDSCPFAPPPISEVVAAIAKEKPDGETRCFFRDLKNCLTFCAPVVFAPHVETSAGIMIPDNYIKELAAAAHAVGQWQTRSHTRTHTHPTCCFYLSHFRPMYRSPLRA